MSKVIFRDRALKVGEEYHHHCEECNTDIHPDLAESHKCNPFIIKLPEYSKKIYNPKY